MSTNKYTKQIKKLEKERDASADTILNDEELSLYDRFSIISNANLLKPYGWIIHPLQDIIKDLFPSNGAQYYSISEEEFFMTENRGSVVEFYMVLERVYDDARYTYMTENHPDDKYGDLPEGVDIKDLKVKIGRVKIGTYENNETHQIYITVREFEDMLLEIAKSQRIVSFTFDW